MLAIASMLQRITITFSLLELGIGYVDHPTVVPPSAQSSGHRKHERPNQQPLRIHLGPAPQATADGMPGPAAVGMPSDLLRRPPE